ncbi:hypothetical protein Tco_0707262 [Tanacetum coccineum]|uniref:Uncharacterized protein n=1 Tax=Tanacetum coccineum TaxID=301880 RepID=A0ABQ4YAT0_9ASTR
MNIAEEANEENTERVEEQKDDEELKADEEHKEDDKAGDEQVVVLISTTHKEKPNLLQSTSSLSVSLNFGDQFINSSNATLIVPNSEAVKFVVQRFTELERAVMELTTSWDTTNKLFLLQSDPKKALKRTPLSLGQSYFQGQSQPVHDHTSEPCDALTWSMRCSDEDLQRDQTRVEDKKTRFNESKLSKNTSTTKESSKGKSLARTSKSTKSMTAKESVKEPVFEIASDNVDQTLDDKVRDVG